MKVGYKVKKENINRKKSPNLRKDFIDKDKPIDLKKERTIIDAIMNLEETKEKGGHITPSSSIAHTLKSIFESGGKEDRVKTGKNNKIRSSIDMYGNAMYEVQGKSDSYQIRVERYRDIITRQDKNTRKVFNFLLQTENSRGVDENNRINFNINELVDRGMYKNKDTAYRGLKTIYIKLMSILIEGNAFKGRREIKSTLNPLIKEAERSYNNCWVEIKPELFSLLKLYFTVLPKWSDKLNANAYAMTDHIYYLARQNLKKIKKDGTFNINLNSLRSTLIYPHPDETNKHKQLIIDPILQAIEEIEDTQREYRKNKENIPLMITPIFKNNGQYTNVHEFLDGYLEIKLDQETAEYFNSLCLKFEKITDNETKRVQALKNKAKKLQV